MSEVCALCKEGFEKESAVTVREKGVRTFSRVSEERDFLDLQRYVLLFSESVRRAKEQYLIGLANTLTPNGMNRTTDR